MQGRNDFVILAKDISLDQLDSLLSIFKIVDKFNLNLTPEKAEEYKEETEGGVVSIANNYFVVTSWSFEQPLKKEIPIMLVTKVFSPKGEELATSEQESYLESGKDRFRLNIQMQSVITKGLGNHKLEVSILEKNTNKVLAQGMASYTVDIQITDSV